MLILSVRIIHFLRNTQLFCQHATGTVGIYTVGDLMYKNGVSVHVINKQGEKVESLVFKPFAYSKQDSQSTSRRSH